MIPWKWLGMTTKASSSTPGKWTVISSQHAETISPADDGRVVSPSISPSVSSLRWVHTVTKYAPAAA
jgi:hypothetical protein